MSQRVAVAVPVPLHRTFSYLWPEDAGPPQPGQRVRVPFGRRSLTGVVVGDDEAEVEGVRLRPVEGIVDAEPLLPPSLLRLAAFVSEYYVAPIGEVVRAMLPGGLGPAGSGAPGSCPTRRVVSLVRPAEDLDSTRQRLRRAPAQVALLEQLHEAGGAAPLSELAKRGVTTRTVAALAARGLATVEDEPLPPAPVAGLAPQEQGRQLTLNSEQGTAVATLEAAVREGSPETFLLHGVTGSGKTEVYLRAAAAALQRARGVLILVPEIGLTPAVVGRLEQRFGDHLAVLHSGLSARERRAHWHRIRSGQAAIVVGARSAVFAPLASVGLVVVDEEQETSYKQEETPRYQARDVAVVRGRLEGCPVVLASATPSMESYARATGGRDHLLTLPRRVARRELPTFEVVDLRQEFRASGQTSIFSRRLLEAIARNRAAGGQAMLLLNRRGWAAFILCRACGEPVQCQQCAVSLTYHRTTARLLCHYCGRSRRLPDTCPGCGEEALQEMGAGTERIEDELTRHVPGLRLLRMDADTVRRRGDHARILARFAAGEADLLLGTQMIAKGHDFPGVTLVGILGGDAILGLPDFRAAEWTFHLVTQAAGRAGRGDEPGLVILQAFRADHYAIARAAAHDYVGFFQQESEFRQALLYPPHAVLAVVRVRHQSLEKGAALVQRVAELLRADADTGEHLRVLGPAPAPLSRLRGRYRFHMLLKSRTRGRLTAVLHRLGESLQRQRGAAGAVSIDVDPVTIL